MRKTMIYLAFVASIAIALPAAAQRPHRGGQGMKGQRFGQHHRQKMGRLLRELVGLDEQTAKEVEAVLESFRPRRQAVRKKVRVLRQKLRELVQSDSNDEQAFAYNIKGLLHSQVEMQQQRRKELRALAKILSPKQHAKLMLAMERMKKRRGGKFGQRGQRQGPGQRFGGRRGQGFRQGGPGSGQFGPGGGQIDEPGEPDLGSEQGDEL